MMWSIPKKEIGDAVCIGESNAFTYYQRHWEEEDGGEEGEDSGGGAAAQSSFLFFFKKKCIFKKKDNSYTYQVGKRLRPREDEEVGKAPGEKEEKLDFSSHKFPGKRKTMTI